LPIIPDPIAELEAKLNRHLEADYELNFDKDNKRLRGPLPITVDPILLKSILQRLQNQQETIAELRRANTAANHLIAEGADQLTLAHEKLANYE
jgi:hypothetical protein